MHPAHASIRNAGSLLALLISVATSAHAASATLHWTAPGGDGLVGRAAAYDLRYSQAWIMPGQFLQATAVLGMPVPSPAGQRDSVTVWGLIPGFEYAFVMRTRDSAGNWSALSNEIVVFIPGPLASRPPTGPARFGPPMPNPARDRTSFALTLPASADLSVEVFDVGGRRIRTLASGPHEPGDGELAWDLTDAAGRPVSAGWYAVRAAMPGHTWMRRVLVVR